jgi:hypothetical protein
MFQNLPPGGAEQGRRGGTALNDLNRRRHGWIQSPTNIFVKEFLSVNNHSSTLDHSAAFS